MPLYDFSFRFDKASYGQGGGVVQETKPQLIPDIYTPEPQNEKVGLNSDSTEYFEPSIIALKAQDRGIKEFFSNIIIPLKDGMRSKPLTVRIAGGEKFFLGFKQDLQGGRVELPIMAINRTGVQFNPQKFSHPTMPAMKRFSNDRGNKMRIASRPWPCLIDYQVSVWAESKRDMEHIMYQIMPRFTPLADYFVEDNLTRGVVNLRFNNKVDNSDVDIGATEKAKVRYDLNFTAEGWIPLPEKIVPTVLGRVAVLDELVDTDVSITPFDPEYIFRDL